MTEIEKMIVQLDKLRVSAEANKATIGELVSKINTLEQTKMNGGILNQLLSMDKALRSSIDNLTKVNSEMKLMNSTLNSRVGPTQRNYSEMGIKDLRSELQSLQTVYDKLAIKADQSKSHDIFSTYANGLSKVSAEMDIILSKIHEIESSKFNTPAQTSSAKPKGGANPTGDPMMPAALGGTINEFQRKLSTLSAEMQKGITSFLGNRTPIDMGAKNIGDGITQFDFELGDGARALTAFVSATGRATSSLEAQSAEITRMQAMNKVNTDPRFAQLSEVARRLGYTTENLRSLTGGGHPIERIGANGQMETVPSRIEALYNRQEGGVNVPQKFVVDSQSGQVITEMQRKFRGFTDSIRYNLTQVAQWTLAIGLIYGPMRKLSEMYQTMIENQSKLADVSIVVNENFQTQRETFDSISKSALKYGEELTGVIDAYGQAYKAVGSRTTPQTRGADATSLLEASLALSKLSNMDEAQAIDILTAALAQTNTEFSNSTDIIDKWVRVAREAKVDVSDLATGTAMLGDAAATANLDIDQLNALISTMAQVTQAGPKEAANSLKMLFSNISTDRAETAMNNLGMSTKDTTGKVKDLWEILMDVVSANEAGLISPTELNNFGSQLLGPRQGKNLVSLIKSPEILMQAYNTSVNGVGGETEAAMAKKLDTVKTASTNMASALGILSQSLGTNGGILDSTSTLLELLTKLALQLDKTTQFFGKATPALAAFGIAAFALKGKLGGIGGSVEMALLNFGKGGFQTKQDAAIQRILMGGNFGFEGETGNGLSFPQKAGLFAQKYSGAAAITGGIALSNALAGEKEAAVGALFGGAAGAALLPIAPTIGAMIGATAGSAFIGSITKDATLEDWFTDLREPKKDESGKPIPQTAEEKALEKIYTGLVPQDWAHRNIKPTADLGMKIANSEAMNQNFMNWLGNLFGGNKPTNLTGVNYARQHGDPNAIGVIDTAYNQTSVQKQIDNIEASPFDVGVKKFKDDNTDLITRMSLDASKDLRDKMNLQEITVSDYGKSIDALGGLGNLGSSGIKAFGEELKKLDPTIISVEDQYQVFLKILTEGNPEQIGFISSSISDIEVLTIQLANAVTEAEKLRIALELADAQTNAATFANAAVQGIDNASTSDFQVQRYPDTTYPGKDTLMAEYNKVKDLYQTAFPEYKLDEQDLGLVFKGNVTDTLHVDLRLLQIAMDKLIDVNQKQLDGIYNFPDGANAWVNYVPGMGIGLGGGGSSSTTTTPAVTTNPAEIPGIQNQYLLDHMMKIGEIPEGTNPITGRPITSYPSGPSTGTNYGGDYWNSEKFGTAPSVSPETTATTTFLEQLMQFFNNLGQSLGIGGGFGGNWEILPNSLPGSQQGAPQVNPAPVSKIDIKFESTTQLIVDGRTLAEIIKPYFAEDLATSEAAAGTITKSFVI